MKICFLENTIFKYDGNDLDKFKLRGAEKVLINLSSELHKIGHDITVINNCYKNTLINGVKWININSYNQKDYFDVAISNGDINLFKKISSKKFYLISHSLQSIEKFIRKNQLINFFLYRPKIILLSNYHLKNRSYLLRLFGHIRLDWSVDNIFLKTSVNNVLKQDQLIFTSRADRNLSMLIDIWKELIYPQNKSLKLLITPIKKNLKKYNIINRRTENQNSLISDLLASKILLIPGHKAELFCLSAEEAKILCIPVVTLGIGCLKERVSHGVTGFIAKNNKEFADYTFQLLNDKILYNKMTTHLKKIRRMKSWNNVAKNLIKNINE